MNAVSAHLRHAEAWADRVSGVLAGIFFAVGSMGAGAAAMFAVEAGADSFSGWLWGGGALALALAIGRAGKYIGDRVDRFQDRYDQERVDRIQAETELRLIRLDRDQLREQLDQSRSRIAHLEIRVRELQNLPPDL